MRLYEKAGWFGCLLSEISRRLYNFFLVSCSILLISVLGLTAPSTPASSPTSGRQYLYGEAS